MREGNLNSETVVSKIIAVGESIGDSIEGNKDGVLDNQNGGGMDSDVISESKERFRDRLWGFLFENLNRAVDELYLLCELECDIDQMKEASLVLDEATLDFRELRSRVEKFEKSKRSPSDGAPSVLPSDHRRPHALSWEVRRMTTSPRRAEILSSSLEAFRKIQQDRAHRAENPRSDVHCHYLSPSDDLEKRDWLGHISRAGDPLTSEASHNEEDKIPSGKTSSGPSKFILKESSAAHGKGKNSGELQEIPFQVEKLTYKKDKKFTEHTSEKRPKIVDTTRRHAPFPERDGDKRNGRAERSLDAWKEKRNWEDVLSSPRRGSSRFSYSPAMGRRSTERARVLHNKLMSPEKKKKSTVDLKKEAEEKHARATKIRIQLENERVQKLQRTSEKLNRVNEWQTVRNNKLRETMFARHQRTLSRHEAYLAQVVRRAGDESSKVNEVRFITSLNEENKKHMLRKKLQDSELRRAEKYQVMRTKQKEDMAREEAVLERRRLIEAEKLLRLAENQRRKEEAQVRREEERKASSAAREAKAMEQLRRKEVRAKVQQEEAELLAQKLAEKLSESEQRRKFYLEQIRERASMDFRDQSSPLFRRLIGKESQAQGKSTPNSNGEENEETCNGQRTNSCILTCETSQHLLKRRIKRIRQRLLSIKHEFLESSVGLENTGIEYRTAVETARGKISKWLQDLQKLRQARKYGTVNFGLISSEIIKFVEGRDAELHASRLAGLLDFIASALPASHFSKPEACQVSIFLLRILKVALSIPENKCYFLVQNLLSPIIPMLAAAIENYIKMAASLNIGGSANSVSSKTTNGNMDAISEITDGFLWTATEIIGFISYNEVQIQMQNGLIELAVAYQIISRLRDLFALYDRPQMEGYPFPSSIILSINFLAVLTSKFRETTLINWEAFTSAVVHGDRSGNTKPSDSSDRGSTLCHSIGDDENLLQSSCTLSTHLPDVPQEKPLNETSTLEARSSSCQDYYSHNLVHIYSKTRNTEAMNGPLRTPTDGKNADLVNPNVGNYLCNSGEENSGSGSDLKHPASFLLSAISETGLVCLPSMLTAVLLQANNRLSSEQGTYVLPSNFEEVATGILKVLNNLALIDVSFIQKMLARPDLKMEFFHLMSFLLSHCTTNWGAAADKIGSLLLESLSLLGYFALFHSENQAVLRWGKSPTIVHKVCDLPFEFFSDPDLMPVLAATLVAASYGCEQNKGIILQELSMDMLLSLLASCKKKSAFTPQNDDPIESNRTASERRDASQKQNKKRLKAAHIGSQRNPYSIARNNRPRNQRDGRTEKLSEESQSAIGQSEASTLTLHSRFPVSFINKAEEFFIA